jgi:SHS2 domain-containing protein
MKKDPPKKYSPKNIRDELFRNAPAAAKDLIAKSSAARRERKRQEFLASRNKTDAFDS